MPYRKYDTCFFERYAMTALQTILGHKFDSLVNNDRPDLQSGDGQSLGIEVTRAMEQGKLPAQQMLKDLAGVGHGPVSIPAYSYGIAEGNFIGGLELNYWKTAQPMRHIIRSKVSKVVSGFYGHFDEFALFVFSKDPLSEQEAISAMKYTMDLQMGEDLHYSRLFLYCVTTLYACNLEDGLKMDYRLTEFPVNEEMRRDFFLSSIDYGNNTVIV